MRTLRQLDCADAARDAERARRAAESGRAAGEK
jgi:hypothetical protein